MCICMMLLCCVMIRTDAEATSINLNTKAVTIYTGKTIRLKVNGTKNRIKWSSSNKKIVTVSQDGTIKGLKAGNATITAKVGKYSLKCKVKVVSVLSTSNKSLRVKKMGYARITLYAKIPTNISIEYDRRYIRISPEKYGNLSITYKIYAKRKGSTYIKVKSKTSKEELRVNIKIR